MSTQQALDQIDQWDLLQLPPGGCSVLNLSGIPLDQEIAQFLSRGAKFSMPPSFYDPLPDITQFDVPDPNWDDLEPSLRKRVRKAVNDLPHNRPFEDFRDRILWAWIFRLEDPHLPSPFLPASGQSPLPELTLPQIRQTLDNLQDELSQIPPKFTPHERTPRSWSSIVRRLHAHLDLNQCILKPADKGACMVLLTNDSYLTEGYRQLSDTKFYLPLDPGQDFSVLSCPDSLLSEASRCLSEFRTNGLISSKQFDFILPTREARHRRFYLLPKIHKKSSSWTTPGRTPPGRPIVSNTNSSTYQLCRYVDYLLAPFSTIHPSYTKDTGHFLSKLDGVTFPPDCTLATMDISSLYTCIDNDKGIAAVRSTMSEFYALHPEHPYVANTCKLLELCLINNTFKFNDSPYIQVSGAAMGHHYAPRLADLYVATLEARAIPLLSSKPLFYARYLDDIFLVFQGSPSMSSHIQDVFNSMDPLIKFTIETSDFSVSFLDVVVRKDEQFRATGKLSTRVYTKPTDTKQLLHRHSYHPPHMFKSVIRSQLVRYHRLSSSPQDFTGEVVDLFQTLLRRGYSYRYLRRRFLSWHADFVKRPRGSYPCQAPGCVCCATGNVQPTTEVTCINPLPSDTPPPPPPETYKIRSHFTCQTVGVVYLIRCHSCGAPYVGHTTKTLRERYQQHLYRHNNLSTSSKRPSHLRSTALYEHFMECGSMEQALLTILHGLPARYQTGSPADLGPTDLPPVAILKSVEALWIYRLGSSVDRGGLNTVAPMHPPVLPFIIPHCSNGHEYGRAAKLACAELADACPTLYALGPIASYTIHPNIRSLFCKSTDP